MSQMNVDLVRKVWAAVSQQPQATIKELAEIAGIPSGPCRRALAELKKRGYINFSRGAVRARTILIPLWEGRNASTTNTN